MVKSGCKLASETAPMHRMNPGGVQLDDAVHDGSDRCFMSENSGSAIESDHRFCQIFSYDCGLVAGLDE
jgi:hypothetical protein